MCKAQGVRQPSPIPHGAVQPQQSQGVPRPGLPTGSMGYPMASQAMNNLAPRPRSTLPVSSLSYFLDCMPTAQQVLQIHQAAGKFNGI